MWLGISLLCCQHKGPMYHGILNGVMHIVPQVLQPLSEGLRSTHSHRAQDEDKLNLWAIEVPCLHKESG